MVGTPKAPLKFPSEPPPMLPCENGRPRFLQTLFVMAKRFNVPSFGSHTGLTTPCSTVNFIPSSFLVRPSIVEDPSSRFLCSFAIDITSAKHSELTQFTHCPPLMTPAENVLSSFDKSSISMILFAISFTADLPALGFIPA